LAIPENQPAVTDRGNKGLDTAKYLDIFGLIPNDKVNRRDLNKKNRSAEV
jgi:hypothetical protein